MHSSLNLEVLRRMVRDRESQLRRPIAIQQLRSRSALLRSIGRQLIRLGACWRIFRLSTA